MHQRAITGGARGRRATPVIIAVHLAVVAGVARANPLLQFDGLSPPPSSARRFNWRALSEGFDWDAGGCAVGGGTGGGDISIPLSLNQVAEVGDVPRGLTDSIIYECLLLRSNGSTSAFYGGDESAASEPMALLR